MYNSDIVFSCRRKAEAAAKPIRVIRHEDLPSPDMTRFGLVGSPTTVERIFPPPAGTGSVTFEGTAAEKKQPAF